MNWARLAQVGCVGWLAGLVLAGLAEAPATMVMCLLFAAPTLFMLGESDEE